MSRGLVGAAEVKLSTEGLGNEQSGKASPRGKGLNSPRGHPGF